MDDAGNEDFYDMLASLAPKKETRGRKLKIKNRSKLSKEIRHDILQWDDYKFEEAAAPAPYTVGLTVSRALIKRVAYNY